MTGYQEIMTDPSYARQIVTFTFPHIGNVGANYEDIEADNPHALGCVIRQDVTEPSSFRAAQGFVEWMRANGRIGLSGVDTRALTRLIREKGAPNGVIAYSEAGDFDLPALIAEARDWPGLEGMDLAKEVTTRQTHRWSGGLWHLGAGYDPSPLPLAGGEEPRSGEGVGRFEAARAHPLTPSRKREGDDARPHVVAIDYGAKRNIFRNLEAAGARVTVMPATATFEEVMAHDPDGFFLSNGPGDPAATGDYALPVIRAMLETGKPLFGICLGHQLLGLAVGARTTKMHQGHRGANHPVKRIADGRVEITSMNHGFAVERESLPANARETHVSLFDGSNCGIELTDRPAFSVQYHPEASPGPQDSVYLFGKFVDQLR
jgi:carbamoyl-phosphate synthase small subunit